MKQINEVVGEIEVERQEQFKKWPDDYSKRPFEAWLLLTNQYVTEALDEYTHKSGNSAARIKLLKAANLALWGLQADSSSDF